MLQTTHTMDKTKQKRKYVEIKSVIITAAVIDHMIHITSTRSVNKGDMAS